MKLCTYGKLNLCLQIYPATSYVSKHQLDSIFCLYRKVKDIIYIKKAKSLNIKYLNCDIPQSQCLVLKSLKYLQKKFGWDINYQIKIKKNIHLGAGLGGGSSDAAAVINYLLRHHPHTSLDLEEIALVLGSDIPFFLSGYSFARVKQYGNFVSPIASIKAKYKVLINQQNFIRTKDVFMALDKNKKYHSQVDVNNVFDCLIYRKPIDPPFFNDLTPYILAINPKLNAIYHKVVRQYGANHYVFFTGSGSSIVLLKKYSY